MLNVNIENIVRKKDKNCLHKNCRRGYHNENKKIMNREQQ